MSKKKDMLEQEKLQAMPKYERKKYIRNKREQEEKKKKIRNILLGIIGIIVFIGLICFSQYNKNQSLHKTYATIGENEISDMEYDFYYNMSTNSWINNNYSYLSNYGLDLEKSFSEQIYDKESNTTWLDFFISEADNFITDVYSLYDDANKNNFVEYEDTYNKYIENIKNYAKEKEYSYEEYIKTMYGTNITIKDFESFIKKYAIASAYDEYKYNEIENSITDKDIENKYNANKDNYNTYNYYMLSIDLEKYTEAEIENLKTKIETSISKINSIENFKTEAKTYLDENFLEENLEYTTFGLNKLPENEILRNWLNSNDRKNGDITSFIDKDNSTYYIVYFVNKFLDDSNTVNFKYIYKTYVEDSKDTEKTLTKTEALNEIQKIKDGFVNNENEDNFDTLMSENSYSGTSEYVTKDSLRVTKMAEWLFNGNRKQSDVEIFEDESTVYLIYFDSIEDPYYKVSIRNELISTKYSDFMKNIKINELKTIYNEKNQKEESSEEHQH